MIDRELVPLHGLRRKYCSDTKGRHVLFNNYSFLKALEQRFSKVSEGSTLFREDLQTPEAGKPEPSKNYHLVGALSPRGPIPVRSSKVE